MPELYTARNFAREIHDCEELLERAAVAWWDTLSKLERGEQPRPRGERGAGEESRGAAGDLPEQWVVVESLAQAGGLMGP